MFVKLALSNLWRNKRRTLFTEVTIVFGILVIVFIGSFLTGMSRNWAISMIESMTGAMQIEHVDYEKEHKFNPLETTLENSDQIITGTESYPGVTAAFGVLEIDGIISNGSKSNTFFGRGVDIDGKYQTLPDADETVGEGKELKPDANEIILGPKLADNLAVKIGESVMLLAQTQKGGLNMVELTVVGLKKIGGGMPDIVSAHYVEINLSTAQKLLRMPGRVSQVIVGFDDFDRIKETIPKLEAFLKTKSDNRLLIKGYNKLIPGYEINSFFSMISLVVGTILFIIVGAGVANAMFMTVMERRKEIGTMKAIGTEQFQIKRLFLFEGISIGILGSILGVIFSVLVVLLVMKLGGIPLPPPPGSSESITIEPYLDTNACIYAVILTLIVSLIASYLPAAVSSKLDPVVTLREE